MIKVMLALDYLSGISLPSDTSFDTGAYSKYCEQQQMQSIHEYIF